MKTIDRHLSAHFLEILVLCLLAFLGLFLLIDFLEKLKMLLKYRPQAGDVLLFFSARIPWMMAQIVPMAALLGTALSVALLARHGEITAYRCGGVPVRRLARPYAVLGLLLSFFGLFLQEIAAPRAAAFSREVREVRIKRGSARSLIQADNLWLHLGPRILHVEKVVPEQNLLLRVSVAEIDKSSIVRRIDARQAVWTREGWVLHDAEERRFNADGTMAVGRVAEMTYPLSEGPEEFRIEKADLQEVSWAKLRRRIRRYETQGLETRELEVGLWAKTSLPLASLIMPLLAFPFALRSARKGGASVGIALGVGIGFAYWLVLGICLAAGNAGTLPAPIAAWGGNILFGALAAVLLGRAERSG